MYSISVWAKLTKFAKHVNSDDYVMMVKLTLIIGFIRVVTIVIQSLHRGRGCEGLQLSPPLPPL